MSRNGYSDAERAQCVTWCIEGQRTTTVQRLFHNRYNRRFRAPSTMRHWREDYQSLGSHAHRVVNGRTQISEERIVRIRQLLDDNPLPSFCTVTAEVGVHHCTVWHFCEKN